VVILPLSYVFGAGFNGNKGKMEDNWEGRGGHTFTCALTILSYKWTYDKVPGAKKVFVHVLNNSFHPVSIL